MYLFIALTYFVYSLAIIRVLVIWYSRRNNVYIFEDAVNCRKTWENLSLQLLLFQNYRRFSYFTKIDFPHRSRRNILQEFFTFIGNFQAKIRNASALAALIYYWKSFQKLEIYVSVMETLLSPFNLQVVPPPPQSLLITLYKIQGQSHGMQMWNHCRNADNIFWNLQVFCGRFSLLTSDIFYIFFYKILNLHGQQTYRQFQHGDMAKILVKITACTHLI
jgi:hypothetical protein